MVVILDQMVEHKFQKRFFQTKLVSVDSSPFTMIINVLCLIEGVILAVITAFEV